MERHRLDKALVDRGLAKSRQQATELIEAGCVLVNAQIASKASQLVSLNDSITVNPSEIEKFVSRAGRKLDFALQHFGIPVEGCVALDVGQSTGGFTDVLLQRGALKVFGVEVGHGQLDSKLKSDPRVVAFEKLNVRDLDTDWAAENCGRGTFPLIVADLSFISLKLVADSLVRLLEKGGDLIVLIKPQFEVGPSGIGKGGLVRDEKLRLAAIESVCQAFVEKGVEHVGKVESPLRGQDGNLEALAHFRKAK